MKKYFTWLLGAIVVIIYAYVASFAFFLIYKEFACHKTLYSQDCYQTYGDFMLRPFGLQAKEKDAPKSATSTVATSTKN